MDRVTEYITEHGIEYVKNEVRIYRDNGPKQGVSAAYPRGEKRTVSGDATPTGLTPEKSKRKQDHSPTGTGRTLDFDAEADPGDETV